MRKNFSRKTRLYPMPVLIIGTYDENGIPNAMNAAWGGICVESAYENGGWRSMEELIWKATVKNDQTIFV